MLKLAQWAYKLGVKNERHRIIALLNEQSHATRMQYDMYSYEIGAANTESRKRKLQLAAAVESRVGEVIQQLFEERGEIVSHRSASLINPEGK